MKNTGIVPQYYVENDHEPIISRELYGQVQEEMARRANLYNSKGGKKRVYSSRYALSSIVYCGECGEIYRRVHWNNRGKKSIVWRCVSRLEEKGSDCTSETILEETLQNGVLQAINQLIEDDGGVNRAIMQNIETALAAEFDKDMSELDREIELVQRELLHYSGAKQNEIAEKLYRLRAEKQEILDYNISRENKRRRIAEINEFLKEQMVRLEEYADKLVRKLVEKVTVFEGYLKVEFKSGVEIEVKV